VIVLLVLLAVSAPLAARHDPFGVDLINSLQPPNVNHWFGTDVQGRDVWARLVYGARVSLSVGIISQGIALTLGVILGLLAGYYGRWVDTITSWLVNIVVAFPFYVLIIALVFALGVGERSIYIAITMVGWVSYTRIVRGEVLVAKRQEYVLAARSAGLSDVRILGRHLLPNVITQAVVFAMSDIVLDILAIVTLGYLGLGVQPPTADWGRMIADGQTYLTTNWQLSTFPGIAVVITALGLSLIADGLADLLRPE
jgi:peptide/nickel transport system permease protein